MFGASTDCCVSAELEKLYYQYPNARFVWTTRPFDAWLASFIGHHDRHSWARDVEGLRRVFDSGACEHMFEHAALEFGLYLNAADLDDSWRAFDSRVRHFFADKPRDKLLELDLFAGQGWEELCGFLGHPIPSLAFRNSTQRRTVSSDPRYALISHSTINLGDEIQSIAVSQFLPRVDLMVDRDALNRLPQGAQGRYKLVLNGWHTRRPENWPPAPEFDTLPISLHLSNEVNTANATGRRPSEALLEGAALDYWRAHAPVGTRDLWTLDLLRAKGVEAYFSACATLTLGNGEALPRHDYVCAVDLPEPVLAALRERTRSRIVVTTHRDPLPAPTAQRVRRAKRLLSLYARARAVVTSRLHCAMPCLAFHTPCCSSMRRATSTGSAD